jgi:hypothetical protein
MEKRDLFVEIKEKSTANIIQEFSQDGARYQLNSAGEIKGKFSATYNETADVVQRMDGSNSWNVRGMAMTKEGDVVMVSGSGTGRITPGSTHGTVQGECTFMTMSPNLSWLNNTKGQVEGTTNLRNGDTDIKVYSIPQKPMQAAAAPVM